ncbi:MAG: phosphoribosylformylglycinamidine synthase subunit PurS [Gemmatimonadetes bacterium]|nr:phosphoribosylformylglycinamidine synthase subunit PurS [Gemmatimonadota bacterium]
MPQFAVAIQVMPRRSLLDPQGQAVEHALGALGFQSVGDVRVGKALILQLERPDRSMAERDARAMCERFLANPVTEDFTVSVRAAE